MVFMAAAGDESETIVEGAFENAEQGENSYRCFFSST